MKAPSGLMIESALADFHALRQGFSPPSTVEHYNAEQLQIFTVLSCAQAPPVLPPQFMGGTMQTKRGKMPPH